VLQEILVLEWGLFLEHKNGKRQDLKQGRHTALC